MKLGTLISQGRVGGNNIAGATSNAITNVTAQETRFHAFLDALKQNAILYAKHFDMSLQQRLGIGSSSLRSSYGDTTVIKKLGVKKKP